MLRLTPPVDAVEILFSVCVCEEGGRCVCVPTRMQYTVCVQKIHLQ